MSSIRPFHILLNGSVHARHHIETSCIIYIFCVTHRLEERERQCDTGGAIGINLTMVSLNQ
jgi:hypothetical protein